MRLKEQLKSSNKPTCLPCGDGHISIDRKHRGLALNGPPSKSQRVMTQCVSDAAVWDPYLPSWLHSFWGPRTQQKHKHRPGPGRVAWRAQINSPENRVLRKQTDPAWGGGDVRTDQQQSRSLASSEVDAEKVRSAGGTRTPAGVI